jgi:hypothetical protein
VDESIILTISAGLEPDKPESIILSISACLEHDKSSTLNVPFLLLESLSMLVISLHSRFFVLILLVGKLLPLSIPTTKEYQHMSSYNNLDRGENTSSEPLAVIAADDPVTCAIYAKYNDLLEPDG